MLSSHAKKRFSERSSYTIEEQKKNAGIALSRGKKPRCFSGLFFEYLDSKQLDGSHYKVRVYKDYIYVFDAYKKCLITVYPVPNKFLPVEQYLTKGEDVERCLIMLKEKGSKEKSGVGKDKEYFYVGEFDSIVDDIALATEFRTKQKAINYIKNNHNLDGYKVVIMPL